MRNGPFWDEVRGKGSKPPIAKLLGRKIRNVDPEAGTIEVEFQAKAAFLSSVGTIQGGLLAAMLDGALGLALRARLPEDQFAPTLELKTSFLRPARVGILVGRGRVRQQGASVAFLEGDLRDPEGQIVATATATAKIVRRSKVPELSPSRRRRLSRAAVSPPRAARIRRKVPRSRDL